jgi:multiple sugar transport system substrate-binding protein
MKTAHATATRTARAIARAFAPAVLTLALILGGCTGEPAPVTPGGVTVVFRHGRIAGDPAAFEAVLHDFEMSHPGIRVREETLPASSDEQHQLLVLALEGGAADFDVLSMDVIWVPEFARAGWIRDLTHLMPPERRAEFFRGPIEAVTFGGRVWAVPWYIDAGVLYYRRDLLEEHGLEPPATWDDLVAAAGAVTAAEPGVSGFVWQGRQYEGLVCNALEFIWSHGGRILEDGRVVLDSPENRRALSFMRDLVHRYGVSHAFVGTSTEEASRHVFGRGEALFLRNWPYAWTLFQREGSRVRGKVGVTTLPAAPGHRTASTLGGWQLGVNRNSPHPGAAETFILYLTSAEVQKRLALDIGYMPSRTALYTDRDLLRARPFLADLRGVFESARPRPVTPYYMMISQVLQPELSAVLAGTKSPEATLRDAARAIEFLLGEGGDA